MTEEEFIEPVKKGTRVVLEACRDFKVERLVVTSSVAAIGGTLFTKEQGVIYGPDDRIPKGQGTVYGRSKSV